MSLFFKYRWHHGHNYCLIASAGLNEVVPDNLLSMFDENELEVCREFVEQSCVGAQVSFPSV